MPYIDAANIFSYYSKLVFPHFLIQTNGEMYEERNCITQTLKHWFRIWRESNGLCLPFTNCACTHVCVSGVDMVKESHSKTKWTNEKEKKNNNISTPLTVAPMFSDTLQKRWSEVQWEKKIITNGQDRKLSKKPNIHFNCQEKHKECL